MSQNLLKTKAEMHPNVRCEQSHVELSSSVLCLIYATCSPAVFQKPNCLVLGVNDAVGQLNADRLTNSMGIVWVWERKQLLSLPGMGEVQKNKQTKKPIKD